MMVILFCKGENEVLKTVCFNGTYTQAEGYINDRAEIPEGTTRTLIVPEENYIFNIDESLRRENEAFEQEMVRYNYEIHKRKKIMEKELNIIPPIGYEIDKEKSTFEKIVFKKIDNTPKTWEEYRKQTKDYVSYFWSSPNSIIKSWFEGNYYEFVTEERVKQYVALGKLLQLRDYWVKRSKFKDAVGVFTWGDVVIVTNKCDINDCALTFPTKEMAEEFKECFGDLIKQAYPLV